MTRNQIIEQLYCDKDINKAISKMQPEELQNDLKQEMFLALCKMPEEKLLTLHKNCGLKFWLIRVMLNMVKSDRSTFYTTYRQVYVELNGSIDKADIPDDQGSELLAKLDNKLNEITAYEIDNLLIYHESKQNISKTSRKIKGEYKDIMRLMFDLKTFLSCRIRNAESEELYLIRSRAIGVPYAMIAKRINVTEKQLIESARCFKDKIAAEKIRKHTFRKRWVDLENERIEECLIRAKSN